MKQMEEVEENVGGSFGGNVNPNDFNNNDWFKWLVIGLIGAVAITILYGLFD